MPWFIITCLTAVTAFAATNIDDIVILTLFFSQVDATGNTFRRRHVVVGQYLGFGALVAISLLGYAGSFLVPRPWIGLLGLVPIGIGLRRLLVERDEPDPTQPAQSGSSAARVRAPLRVLVSEQTYHVAAVTFANGGDNIGAYVPLFATSSVPRLVVLVGTFFVLLAVWCYVGYRVSRQPHVTTILSEYGHLIVPLVLIGLGVYITVDSGTFTLGGV